MSQSKIMNININWTKFYNCGAIIIKVEIRKKKIKKNPYMKTSGEKWRRSKSTNSRSCSTFHRHLRLREFWERPAREMQFDVCLVYWWESSYLRLHVSKLICFGSLVPPIILLIFKTKNLIRFGWEIGKGITKRGLQKKKKKIIIVDENF